MRMPNDAQAQSRRAVGRLLADRIAVQQLNSLYLALYGALAYIRSTTIGAKGENRAVVTSSLQYKSSGLPRGF